MGWFMFGIESVCGSVSWWDRSDRVWKMDSLPIPVCLRIHDLQSLQMADYGGLTTNAPWSVYIRRWSYGRLMWDLNYCCRQAGTPAYGPEPRQLQCRVDRRNVIRSAAQRRNICSSACREDVQERPPPSDQRTNLSSTIPAVSDRLARLWKSDRKRVQ